MEGARAPLRLLASVHAEPAFAPGGRSDSFAWSQARLGRRPGRRGDPELVPCSPSRARSGIRLKPPSSGLASATQNHLQKCWVQPHLARAQPLSELRDFLYGSSDWRRPWRPSRAEVEMTGIPLSTCKIGCTPKCSGFGAGFWSCRTSRSTMISSTKGAIRSWRPSSCLSCGSSPAVHCPIACCSKAPRSDRSLRGSVRRSLPGRRPRSGLARCPMARRRCCFFMATGRGADSTSSISRESWRPEFSVVAVAPNGPGGEPIPRSIEAMAADRLPAILEARPTGPYRLAGHCVGGIVALETARLLMRLNHQVETVVMIDSPLVIGGAALRIPREASGGHGQVAAPDDAPIEPVSTAFDWGLERYQRCMAAYSPSSGSDLALRFSSRGISSSGVLEGRTDEASTVHGRADHRGSEGARGRGEDGRSGAQAWRLGSDALQLEGQVRRPGGV